MNRERVRMMFRASRDLSPLIMEERFNKQVIALATGSHIAMGWASSVSKLASRPMRVVIFDECDKPGYLIAINEWSAISLGIQQTETSFNLKIGILSTPANEVGNVWKRRLSCDAIFDRHVPCPRCGQYQPLRWDRKVAGGFESGFYPAEDGTFHELGFVARDGGRGATPEQIERAGIDTGGGDRDEGMSMTEEA
jgi:phage terminase large subunit GpA-like protein